MYTVRRWYFIRNRKNIDEKLIEERKTCAAIKPMRRRLLVSIIDHREFFRSSKLVAKVVDIIQGMSTRMITFSNAPTFFHYS